MKHLLLTTIAAVVLVGCGESQQSSTQAETKPSEPVDEVTARPSPPPSAEVKPAETVAEAAQQVQSLKPLSKADKLLFGAAETGNIEAVKQHLAAGTDVNTKDEDGGTPLHRAAERGHKETAELLIAQGADDSCRSYPCTSWKCGRVGQCSSKPEPSVS
jgi:hypothetical protein